MAKSIEKTDAKKDHSSSGAASASASSSSTATATRPAPAREPVVREIKEKDALKGEPRVTLEKGVAMKAPAHDAARYRPSPAAPS